MIDEIINWPFDSVQSRVLLSVERRTIRLCVLEGSVAFLCRFLKVPFPDSNMHICLLPTAPRHGDGLYDSYMRTDHILKEDADTNSPSDLPPMPKHTVCTRTHAHTHTRTHMHAHTVLISCTTCRISRHPAPVFQSGTFNAQGPLSHSLHFPLCPCFLNPQDTVNVLHLLLD